MKRVLLLIPFVVICLGCTGPSQNGTGDNQTYRGIGVTSFYADAYSLPSGSMTNIKLDVKNYGDTTARNIKAELIGWHGQDISIVDSVNETESLEPGQEAEFYWVIQMPVLSISTDVVYSIDARVYFDYYANATKELIFEPRIQTPAITAGGGESVGPLDITITSMEPIYASTSTDFTVTLKLENIDLGFVAYRNADGTENTVYKYYIKSMNIKFPDTWTAIHPDQWNTSQTDNITMLSLTTMELFMDCTQCGCPTGYECDQSNIKRCYSGDDYIDANSCENLDRRLYLVRGERVNFGIGFTRDAVAVETVENINVGIDYSYATTAPTSLDITVRGQEQTY